MPGPPSFDHLLDFTDKSCTRWASFMGPHAERLSDILYKMRPNSPWGVCMICNIDYPLNMSSHLHGKAHCKKLQEKLDYRAPQSPAELEKFTQYWPMERGTKPYYCFNHITGEQGFVDALPEAGGDPGSGGVAAQVNGAHSSMAAPRVELPPPEGYTQGIQSKGDWRNFMDVPSQVLEDFLFQATGSYGATCMVCSADMGRGAHDHLQSQAHYKKLWEKLNGREPPLGEAVGLHRPWVQHFDIPGRGEYLFNHLTGEQQMVPAGASVPVTGPPPAAAPAPAAYPPPQPQPPQQSLPQEAYQPVQVKRSMWDDVPEDMAMPPLAAAASYAAPSAQLLLPGYSSGSGASPTPSVAGSAVVPNFASRVVDVRTGLARYKDALNSKGAWRSFMEPPARELEDQVSKATGTWGGSCPVCGMEMTRGISDHLPSVNHWKNLWDRLNQRIPDVADAYDWDKPWVQKWNFPQGVYVFNHVTGEQGFEHEVRANGGGGGAAGPPGHAAPAAAAPAPYGGGGPSSYAGPCSAPSAAPTGHASPKVFDIAAWMWRRHIQEGANILHRALGEVQGTCDICDAPIEGGLREHLQSAAHFGCLQRRLDKRITAPPYADDDFEFEEELRRGPWVQTLRSEYGARRFNHITGAVEALET